MPNGIIIKQINQCNRCHMSYSMPSTGLLDACKLVVSRGGQTGW